MQLFFINEKEGEDGALKYGKRSSVMKTFKQSVKEALKYYVYALVDPRDKRIFYIGKGIGDRVFQHAEASLDEMNESLKHSKIRDIHNAGMEVEYYIIRHNLTEQEAFLVESVAIDLLTYKAFNTDHFLTNLVSGHHQWNEGIKTENEINLLYDCEKIEPLLGERLLLVSLNRTYNQSNTRGINKRESDYESARKYWAISANKAPKIDYMLGIYRGIVRIVIDVKNFIPCDIAEDGTVFPKNRYAFEGDVMENSPYLNKDVNDYPFGSGGSHTYIPRDSREWH